MDVPDVDSVLRYFDELEVQKSVAGPPYADAASLTGLSAQGATLVGTGTVFTHLAGTALNLDVSGVGIHHVFVGPNPMTIVSILRELREYTSIAVTSVSGRLKISTDKTGMDERLLVQSGTANALLGFTISQAAFGLDHNVYLLPGVESYSFVDHTYPYQNGWYRVRYVNSSTGETDAWQAWFLGSGATAVQQSSLIEGTARLATLDGLALEGAEVTVVNCMSPLITDAYFMAGASITARADSSGVVTVSLVRGSLVDVIIKGTSLIRRIQVPTVGDSFDLLDARLQVDDPFGIQLPDLPAAVRHS
jgi:hypothetical protein